MTAAQKLKLGSWLLVGSMLPFCVDFRWNGPVPAEPIVYVITLVTLLIALWAMRGGKAGWVVGLLRGILQVVLLAVAVMAMSGRSSRIELLTQTWLSLAIGIGALWFLLNIETRTLVWAKKPEQLEKPPSRLRSPRLLFAIFGCALLFGSAEQWFVYLHISALELFLRPMYLFLPWAGAWLFLRRGRDSIGLGMLGAFLGDWLGEILSAVITSSSLERAITSNILPIGNLPALVLGLAIAIFLPRRPRPIAVIGMLGAQLLYRQLALSVAALFSHGDIGGMLSIQAVVIHAAFGASLALAFCKLRATEDPPAPAPPPEKLEAAAPEKTPEPPAAKDKTEAAAPAPETKPAAE